MTLDAGENMVVAENWNDLVLNLMSIPEFDRSCNEPVIAK